MVLVYQDLLPEAYLLVLTAGTAANSEAALARYLRLAAQCDRPAVWLDCRLIDNLSPTAGRLLRRLHQCLHRRQARLVLCRVSDELAACLHRVGAVPPGGFLVAGSLDEAANGQTQTGPLLDVY